MPCYHPLNAYRHPHIRTASGNRKVVIVGKKKPPIASTLDWLVIPCGTCIGCRISKSKEWSIRCMDEASLYSKNCFITLTFNPENMSRSGTLVKKDFQKFMKRLRKNFAGADAVDLPAEVDQSTGEITREHGVHWPIRFFHCGEYGENFQRPHHHAILFNFDFEDKELLKTVKGNKIYVSESLEELWSKRITVEQSKYYKLDTLFRREGKLYTKLGFCTIGSVTPESTAYVARYCLKKLTGGPAWDHYRKWDPITEDLVIIEPEYITMSRRPGIAKNYIANNFGDAYPKDYVTSKGKKFKVPKYYDAIYDEVYPEELAKIKERRKQRAIVHALPEARLEAGEKIVKQRTHSVPRSYESDDDTTLLISRPQNRFLPSPHVFSQPPGRDTRNATNPT